MVLCEYPVRNRAPKDRPFRTHPEAHVQLALLLSNVGVSVRQCSDSREKSTKRQKPEEGISTTGCHNSQSRAPHKHSEFEFPLPFLNPQEKKVLSLKHRNSSTPNPKLGYLCGF